MPGTLLVAYGNVSRRDDGVAIHILRCLRVLLGLPPEADDEENEQQFTEQVTAVAMHQLGPELVEELASYDRVVFIDAHTEAPGWRPVHWQEITPANRSSIVTHHVRPETLLALCLSLYNRSPQGYILSVLGVDFDFGEGLAADTANRAEQAATLLYSWLVSVDQAGFGEGR